MGQKCVVKNIKKKIEKKSKNVVVFVFYLPFFLSHYFFFILAKDAFRIQCNSSSVP